MNETLRQLAATSTNVGRLEAPDLVGQAGVAGEGPFMTMYLRLAGERIAEARFETYGCPTAIACGTWVARWAVARRISELDVLTAHDLARVLGGLPLGKEHCAALAVDSLRKAIDQWRSAQPRGTEFETAKTAYVGKAAKAAKAAKAEVAEENE